MKNCLIREWLIRVVLYVTMWTLSGAMAVESWQLKITLRDHPLAGTGLYVKVKLHGSLGDSDYLNMGSVPNPSPNDVPPVIFEKILNSSIQVGRLNALGMGMIDDSDPILVMKVEVSNNDTTYVFERNFGFKISSSTNYNLKTWKTSWDDCREAKYCKMKDNNLGTLISSSGKRNKFDCGSACSLEENCHAYRMHANMCELYSDVQPKSPGPYLRVTRQVTLSAYEYHKLTFLRRYDGCVGR
ncbi:uncharacterized protein LOC135500683 [Lineus longissimus]|uniref:uncharacterized protein LOC135500683 n=1 Tax=Lineus longissimus TaxID=88925 RepID=UPI00315D811C